MNLVEKLKQQQRDMQLKDGPFAAEIGVNRTMWVQVRNGKKRPGRRFLAGVMRRFPTLTDDCVLHLRDNPAIVVPANVTNSEPKEVTL